MKITKQLLKEVIEEEVRDILFEQESTPFTPADRAQQAIDSNTEALKHLTDRPLKPADPKAAMEAIAMSSAILQELMTLLKS